MLAYIVRRLLLIIPTLFGIMVVNFAIVQFAPGGPIEQIIAQVTGQASSATGRIGGGGAEVAAGARLSQGAAQTNETYRGAQGLDPEFIKQLQKQFGFDKPLYQRFLLMMGNYLRFDFGKSYYRDESVIDLVLSRLPVSISLGVWTTLIAYLVSIPLGIRKAVRDGTRFDIWTSSVIIVGYAIPG